jgi:hypothetical protein
MNSAAQVDLFAPALVKLGLYLPPPHQSVTNTARWRINGYPAHIVIWTSEEWEMLSDRPNDAQYFPCGVWCALRID